ncbi:MAG: GNAT family N-acetyltransferase [Candidatus Zixiibacteriota bacterium]|nr:MAG: GNAT family N-acetyltransferase [candidate division Zixibacteria bacterium]
MAEKPKPPPAPPSLVGKHVYLRASTAKDAVNIHYWFLQSDPQAQCCSAMRLLTTSQAAEVAEQDLKATDREKFTIVRKSDDLPVGQVAYFNYNALNRSAELGLIMDPDERKQGLGREAMKLLIKYLFRFRDLNKVYAQTAEFNDAAIALLESIGFEKDGTLRQHHFYDGEYHDQLIYSLLRFDMNW